MSRIREDWISVAEFSRRIGLGYHYVLQTLKAKGGLERRRDGKIEFHKTKAWWDSHIQIRHRPRKYRDGPGVGSHTDSSNTQGPHAELPKDSQNSPEEIETARLSFLDRKDKADAEKKELEVAKLKGQLLDKATVVKTVFEFARNARENLRGLPKRWAGTFATETDQRVIQDIMEREIESALQGLEEVKL